MASISTSITLVDNVSRRLAVIAAGVAELTNTFAALSGAVDAAQADMAAFDGSKALKASNAPGTASGGLKIEAVIAPKIDATALEAARAEMGQRLQAMLDGAAAAWQGDAMEALGAQVPRYIASGVEDGSGHLLGCVREVSGGAAEAAGEAMRMSVGRGIGLEFSSGLAAGIRAGKSGVVNAARSMANAAASAARAALDIHSPSRVMEKAGGYFGEGFSLGITDSMRAVQQSAMQLAQSAREAVQRASSEEVYTGAGFKRVAMNMAGSDDLRRVRENAREDGVNRFTSAQVHVDFTANNQISNNMDLDEVVRYLEQQLTERLAMAAEGVYA